MTILMDELLEHHTYRQKTDNMDKGQADVLEVSKEDTEDLKEEEKIRCKKCKNVITDYSAIISVNGSHRHDFANPHGYIFEIGCFRLAEGCLYSGKLTGEFTWFPGYTWKYAVCSSCQEHMGWLFVPNTSGDAFCGLIVDNLSFNN